MVHVIIYFRPTKYPFFLVLIPTPSQHYLVPVNTICLELFESILMTFWGTKKTCMIKEAPVTRKKPSFKIRLLPALHFLAGFELGSASQKASNSASCNPLIIAKNWAVSLPLLVVYSCSPETRPNFRVDSLWVCMKSGRSGWKSPSIWQYADLSGRHTASLLHLLFVHPMVLAPWVTLCSTTAECSSVTVTWNAACPVSSFSIIICSQLQKSLKL